MHHKLCYFSDDCEAVKLLKIWYLPLFSRSITVGCNDKHSVEAFAIHSFGVATIGLEWGGALILCILVLMLR